MTAEPRDWLDYVSAWAGVVGALLAAAAIVYAARESRKAKSALASERKNTFELGLLAEMRRQAGLTQFQHLAGFVGAFVRDSSDESELPLTRVLVGTKAGPVGREQYQAILENSRRDGIDPQDEYIRRAYLEIDAAIDSRLER